jgi:hypothetical protein
MEESAEISQRLNTKRLIQALKKDYNELVEKNIFAAASNVNLNKIIGYKKDGEKHTFLEDYKGRRMPDEEAKRDLK